MDTSPEKTEFGSQNCIVEVILAYDNSPSKADEILSAHSYLSSKYKGFSRICQFIFLTLLRNKALIAAALNEFSKKPPRKKLRALAQAAAAEIILADEQQTPKIVDSWVEAAKKICSKGESAFVNAFLRKFLLFIKKTQALDNSPENLALKFGQQVWLVDRWIKQFGLERTFKMLELLQKPSEVFFRKSPSNEAMSLFKSVEKFFLPTDFENFYALKSGNWENVSHLLNSPNFYIQDPSTSLAPKLLNAKTGGYYLDLCAAPGGKSRLIADSILEDYLKNSPEKISDIKNLGTIVSVDFGKKRMRLLNENMSKIDFIKSYLVECNLAKDSLADSLSQCGAPALFDGVFLDAPCSNTGVLRRRPDARWRISLEDIFNCKKIQAALLDSAAKFVKIGGRLVFSTCSIDRSENEENAEDFIKRNPAFTLIGGKTHLCDEQSDGCGAFVFERIN